MEVDTVSIVAMFSSVESEERCVSSLSVAGRNVPGTVPLNLSEKVISNQLTAELAGVCLNIHTEVLTCYCTGVSSYFKEQASTLW